jgi:hypothetical protein
MASCPPSDPQAPAGRAPRPARRMPAPSPPGAAASAEMSRRISGAPGASSAPAHPVRGGETAPTWPNLELASPSTRARRSGGTGSAPTVYRGKRRGREPVEHRLGGAGFLRDRLPTRLLSGRLGAQGSTWSRGHRGPPRVGGEPQGEEAATIPPKARWSSGPRPGWPASARGRPCVPVASRLTVRTPRRSATSMSRAKTAPPMPRHCRSSLVPMSPATP